MGTPGGVELSGTSPRGVAEPSGETDAARPAPLQQIESAGLSLLTSTLSDLVAYGEMTFSDRVPENNDFVAHTVTARDGSFDTTIFPGKTGRTVLTKPGKTIFFCRFHPTMMGAIDVAP